MIFLVFAIVQLTASMPHSCMRRISRSVSFFFFKQKTAYEMRISDWSSDVCSSDLDRIRDQQRSRIDHHVVIAIAHPEQLNATDLGPGAEIGRASCRERVCQYV